MILLVLVFALSFLILFSSRRTLFWKNRPPGPPILPLAGSFISIYHAVPGSLSKPYEAIHQLSLRFGEIMTIGLGPEVWVVLSGIESMREFCMMEDALARPYSKTFHEIYSFEDVDEPLGVIFSDGQLWREHRKFMTRTLKAMGVGKKSLDNQINEEFLICANHLRRLCKENDVVEMQNFFDLPSLNVIWQLVCGRRFEYDDKMMKKMISHIEAFTMESYIGPIVGTPILKHVPPFKSCYVKVKSHMSKFKAFLSNFVSDEKLIVAKMEDDENEMNINYMSAYFTEQMAESGSYYSDKQLVVSMEDFFTGGSGTMSKTMAYGILYLIHNPEVQTKVQEEIDKVLLETNTDLVTLDIKSLLPYTEATVSEVQRLASVLPISPPRLTTKDITLNGYLIKKNTPVQCNLYSLHRNPDHFTDPDVFRPERFLTADGLQYKPDDWLQPFGYGKRKCLGESVAKSTIFLFLSNMFAKFSFSIDESKDSPSLLPEGGLTIGPRRFSAKVIPRC